MASKEIRVPDLGNFKDVAVIDVLVHPGDSVQVDTPLLTLETEKATMDVPSPDAGVVEQLHVQTGARVSTGSLIATLSLPTGGAAASAGSATAASSAPAAAPARPAASSESARSAAPSAASVATAGTSETPGSGADRPDTAFALANRPGGDGSAPPAGSGRGVDASAQNAGVLPPINELGFSRAHASPSVRRFARELGVDLVRVRGSGPKGRITLEDLKSFVKSVMGGHAAGAPASGWPQVSVPDFAQFGPIEIKPLTRVQRIAGTRLRASWVNLPHVTQFDEADISGLEQLRQSLKGRAELAGIKLTTLAFIVRACVKALQRYPQFNSSLDESGENLVYKKYIHIGFAADTPQGLLVPVIRDADRKDIYETARSLAELAEQARTAKLAGTQMQGGSFTISSLGGIGGTAFTPIINAPEVAILGVSRASQRAVFRDGAFVPRLILPLSLSYDHRVIDGAAGARFTSYLASVLADAHSLVEAVP